MRGQKRPLADRTRALGIAVVDGPEAASRETGVPESTIRGWMDTAEFAELRERTKETVVAEWWAIVQRGFRRTAELLEGASDVQKAATATAIIADKMLLIRGDATSRIESVTGDLSADVKRELRARLARSVHSESVLDGAEQPADRTGVAVDS